MVTDPKYGTLNSVRLSKLGQVDLACHDNKTVNSDGPSMAIFNNIFPPMTFFNELNIFLSGPLDNPAPCQHCPQLFSPC
jgi:hypothetical protein